jgi:hypothetical protein
MWRPHLGHARISMTCRPFREVMMAESSAAPIERTSGSVRHTWLDAAFEQPRQPPPPALAMEPPLDRPS